MILRTAPGRRLFDGMGAAANAFLDLADTGSIFVFGEAFRDHFIVFKVLPTIIFFSSFITVLYYLGVMQKVVRGLRLGDDAADAHLGRRVAVGGRQHLRRPHRGAAPHPPLRQALTRSELMAVMTGGFVTIAGGVMVVYVGILGRASRTSPGT